MAPSKNNQVLFERRRKEHNIVFVEDLKQCHRPAKHAKVFESIDRIKEISYQSYACEDSEQEPWKKEAKSQARKLAEKAHDCIARNEPTWRLACEPLVFSRLTSEVACKNCRRRVWRSEVEAVLDTEDRAAERLRARQQTRDRCRCPRNSRPEDEDERVGLNRLFIDRADDAVEHPPDLAQKLPQEQRPDRIYGLRQTRNFENLLLTSLAEGEYVEDKLARQPHAGVGGEPLLFPFLVVEAKAGNAADDWASICLQTSFPIYTYLNTQKSLILATEQKTRWSSGPLVWFFASRGQDWRLYLAYQSPLNSASPSSYAEHTTTMAQAWRGCITNRDDAIQLFLIVDFLADWARDVYRPAVLTELRILQFPDEEVATVFTDTDIFSTGDMSISFETHSDFQYEDNFNSSFRDLDSQLGAVRHISGIESRFLSIIITADNVHTLLRSVKGSTRAGFIRKLLEALHLRDASAKVPNIDRIDAIEEAWTGHSRLSTILSMRGTKLYTAHQTVYYLSPSWGQVRDLSLIAVAEDALEVLIKESGLKAGRGKASEPSHAKENMDIVDRIAPLKDAPARHNLLACITRRVGSIDSSCLFKKSQPIIWELVSSTYKVHKRGDLEPELPFLKVSKCLDTQTERQDYKGPLLVDDALHVSDQGAVLIHGGRCPQALAMSRRNPAKICVYIVRDGQPAPEKAELAHIVKTTFENYDVYHTTRDPGTLRPRAEQMYRRAPRWNLERSYGLFYDTGVELESFSQWSNFLIGGFPVRQGSPRGPTDTGQIMFRREYFPWQDPGQKRGGVPFEKARHEFVREYITGEAQEWTAISRQKRRQGITCCVYCAKNVAFAPDCDPSHHTSSNETDQRQRVQLPEVCNTCTEALDPLKSFQASQKTVAATIKRVLMEQASKISRNRLENSKIQAPRPDRTAQKQQSDARPTWHSQVNVDEFTEFYSIEDIEARAERRMERERLHEEYSQKYKWDVEALEDKYKEPDPEDDSLNALENRTRRDFERKDLHKKHSERYKRDLEAIDRRSSKRRRME